MDELEEALDDLDGLHEAFCAVGYRRRRRSVAVTAAPCPSSLRGWRYCRCSGKVWANKHSSRRT